MLVFALGGCGESDEEKAQNTVCDARDDINKQVDELAGLTPATVTTDAVTQNLDAIKNDLNDISDAQGDLSSDRRSEAEAANKAFTSSVQGIAERARQLALGLGCEGAGRHCARPARGVLPEGVRAAELRLKGLREMADRPVFLYAAVYDEIADAEADYEAVFDLHAAGAIGTFDSAVIRKEDDGKVRVTKTEKPTQHGAWTGAGVGALVGIIFPPAILGAAIVGAGAGGLTGHLTKGISRGDLKELGDELEAGTAAVIVLGESKIEEQLEKAMTARQQADREAGRCRR